MPPRHNRFDDDPFYSIWRQTNTDPDTGNLRPGFLQHREIAKTYEEVMDMDGQTRKEFWADYSYYMVSKQSGVKRNETDPRYNPFWSKWGIDPNRQFDWHAWREAQGYPHGRRR